MTPKTEVLARDVSIHALHFKNLLNCSAVRKEIEISCPLKSRYYESLCPMGQECSHWGGFFNNPETNYRKVRQSTNFFSHLNALGKNS